MSITRVPINGTTSGEVYYQGKASFCFYRKGSVGSGLTDVAVYADNEYMGIMSISEHFKLNRTVNTWKFRPVDPLLVGEFVLADSAEEYNTSQVSGSVVVTSTVDNNELISQQNGGFLADLSVTGVTTYRQYLINPLASSKNIYVKSVKYSSSQTFSGLSLITYSLYTGGDFTNKTLGNIVQTKLPPVGAAYGASAAFTSPDTAGIVYGGVFKNLKSFILQSDEIKFERPVILPPGYFMGVNATLSASGNFTCGIDWYEK